MATESDSRTNVALAIHGGAGTISRLEMTVEKEAAYRAALRAALLDGWTVLEQDGSSLDAVEAAVRSLEDVPLFNAGSGAVFTHDGRHEMDACVMSGADLRAGAVASVGGIKNPVALARLVMERTEHVLLCGTGAEQFAREAGAEFADDDYFYDELRYRQLLEARRAGEVRLDHSSEQSAQEDLQIEPSEIKQSEKKFGTVGAVACDVSGDLAAATSTGGMTNKKFGRIGDTPVIGAGTYADNRTCAVSCTGHGEYFMRLVTAYDVACLMKYKGMSLSDACEQAVNETLTRMGGEGGLIAVDAQGNLALPFNSPGMYRAWISSTEDTLHISIYQD